MTEALALIVFLLPLAYSPGPGNSFFAVNGALYGVRAIVPALIGYHIPTFIVTFAIGYGLSVSFLADPKVGLVLKILSSAYMFWIAFLCLRAAMSNATRDGDGISKKVAPPSFVMGAILMLSNPKGYAIIAAMLSGFLGKDTSLLHLFFITAIFTLNNMVAFLAWAFAGRGLTKLLNGRISYLIYGVSFLAVGLWMLLR